MPRITFVEFNGTEHSLDIETGTSLMQAAIDNGIDAINGDCGGGCSCATCHCYIEAPWSRLGGSISDTEQSMLEHVLEPKTSSRLGCQVIVTEAMDGMRVDLPESQY